MAFNDPTAIDTAITNGATWASNSKILDGGTKKRVQLSGGVWSLNAASGDLISQAVFDVIKDGTVDTDPGPYQYTILAADGSRYQLVSQTGYARLIDP